MNERHPDCIHPLCGCAGTVNCKSDPMNQPLPCDVKVGAITFRKGVKLGTFVMAAQRWHREAFPDFYTLTDEQKAENLARLQSCAAHGLAHPYDVCAAESQLEQMRQDGNADDVTEAVAHLERVKHEYGVAASDAQTARWQNNRICPRCNPRAPDQMKVDKTEGSVSILNTGAAAPARHTCLSCNGTGIEGIDRGEGLMPRCGECGGSGDAL